MSPRALALLKGVFVRTLHLGIGITTVMLTLTLFRYDFNAPHSHVGLVYLTTGALAMAVAIVGAIDLCWDVLNTYVVTTTDTINLILFGTNIVILTVAHSAISCPGDDSSYADGRCQLASGLFWIQLAGSVTSLIIRYTHRKLKSVVHCVTPPVSAV